MLKIGAMSYALHALVPEAEQTPERLIALGAELGLDGIELFRWGTTPEELDQASDLRALADRLGIEIYGIGSVIRLGYHDERCKETQRQLHAQIDACAAVGGGEVTIPAIDSQPVPPGRDPAAGGMPFGRALGPMIEQLKELAAHAAERAVRLAILNHCYLVSGSWHQEWIVKLSEAPNVGACFDPGCGLSYECEDPIAAAKRIAPYAIGFRLSDVVRPDDAAIIARFRQEGQLSIYKAADWFGEGLIDHAGCLKILVDGGYDGWLTLKRAGLGGGDPREALQHALKQMRAMAGDYAVTEKAAAGA
ncbi:MAG: sugar phosphate isomerase/epimerase [Kiritimatiellae bacterium]|nr:sugar phosphate isomerase/epimerase [Kiritimatiellia bacterium]